MLQAPHFDSIYFKHVYANKMKAMLGKEYDNYFKFAFVRNPWDWLVSNYSYNRGLHRPFIQQANCNKNLSSSDWADQAKDLSFSEWLPWWVENFTPSQSAMLVDDEGNLLVDEVYRFESLKSDSKKLRKRLGIWSLRPLPHRESSKRTSDYREYYEPDSIEFVKKHFQADFELFNYPKSLS